MMDTTTFFPDKFIFELTSFSEKFRFFGIKKNIEEGKIYLTTYRNVSIEKGNNF